MVVVLCSRGYVRLELRFECGAVCVCGADAMLLC